MALKFKSTLLLRFPHFTFCSSVYISNANFVLISGQAKSPKRLSLRVSARSSSILRKPRNANLSRPSTCRLVWRTTIPKRTSVSLAPLSTFHPICWGSRPGWRTLTQGLKNWVDEVKFILYFIVIDMILMLWITPRIYSRFILILFYRGLDHNLED